MPQWGAPTPYVAPTVYFAKLAAGGMTSCVSVNSQRSCARTPVTIKKLLDLNQNSAR